MHLSEAQVCKTRSLTVTVHISLSAEPLLAGAAVLDVLQHFRQHGALQPFLISRLLKVIVCSGTYGKRRPPSHQLPGSKFSGCCFSTLGKK